MWYTLENCLRLMAGHVMGGIQLNSNIGVPMKSANEIEGRLNAANALLDTLSQAIGPTCGFTASECPGGGWLIMSDGKPFAACTEPWEVPEIMGRVMAAKFGRSFVRPEEAREAREARDVDVHDDQLPRIMRKPKLEQPQVVRPSDLNGLSPRTSTISTLILAMVAVAVSLAGTIIGV